MSVRRYLYDVHVRPPLARVYVRVIILHVPSSSAVTDTRMFHESSSLLTDLLGRLPSPPDKVTHTFVVSLES